MHIANTINIGNSNLNFQKERHSSKIIKSVSEKVLPNFSAKMIPTQSIKTLAMIPVFLASTIVPGYANASASNPKGKKVKEIPLIEIENPILLHCASEADRKDKRTMNGLLDTQEELDYFKQAAIKVVNAGLCSKTDYENVLKIDRTKVKTQVTSTENAYNKYRSTHKGKSYDVQYYKDLLKLYEKELDLAAQKYNEIKPKLEQAEQDVTNCPAYELSDLDKLELVLIGLGILTMGVTALQGIGWSTPVYYYSYDAWGVYADLAYYGRDLYITATSCIGLELAGDKAIANKCATGGIIERVAWAAGWEDTPQLRSAKERLRNMEALMEDIKNALNEANANIDKTNGQTAFLEYMEENKDNFVKIVDQRASFLQKLNTLSPEEAKKYLQTYQSMQKTKK